MCGKIKSYYDLRDTIKEQVPIVDYLKTHYPELHFKHVGKRELCSCPFVPEKDPSFNVYSDSNKFYCYSCHERGDLIHFVSKYENITFNQACDKIADNAGIHYEIEAPNEKHEQYKNSMDDNCKRYEKNLFNNEEALNYIRCRGISIDTIKKFRLGYVEKGEREHRKDCVYDIEQRISFPFLEYGNDNTSRCLGMAYRTLVDGHKPKYTNDANHSDDNDDLNGVFNKGNFLFGYNQAKDSIKKSNCAIVVEGYFDVLALHEAGLTNVTGVCGTAFTEAQANLLLKLTKDIYFFLDPDKAGSENMVRVLPMLLEKGFNVKFVKPKECNYDPADICIDLEFDTLKIRNYISSNSNIAVIDIIDEKVKHLTKLIINQQTKILNEMEDMFSNISNSNDKLVYKDYLLKRIGLK